MFHALIRWDRGGDGGGGAAGGGGGESKSSEGENRDAAFVELLGSVVRASLLRSRDLSIVVLGEPLVENSLIAYRSMNRVLRERAVNPSESAQFASPEPLCRRRADAGVMKIYAVGGQDEAQADLDSVDCFDPSTGQWSVGAPLGTI